MAFHHGAEAASIASNEIANQPDNPRLYLARAISEAGEQSVDADLEEALRLNRDGKDVRLTTATIWEQEGRDDQALQVLHESEVRYGRLAGLDGRRPDSAQARAPASRGDGLLRTLQSDNAVAPNCPPPRFDGDHDKDGRFNHTIRRGPDFT